MQATEAAAGVSRDLLVIGRMLSEAAEDLAVIKARLDGLAVRKEAGLTWVSADLKTHAGDVADLATRVERLAGRDVFQAPKEGG